MYPPGLADRMAEVRVAEFHRQAARPTWSRRSPPTRSAPRHRRQPWRVRPYLLVVRFTRRG
jgi:hypothetical protein